MNRAGWTEVSDVVATLRRRWNSGRYLRAHASGQPWEPIRLPVKGPASTEVLDRFDEIRSWCASLEVGAPARFEIEHRSVRGRNLGSNRIPARVRVATFDQLCRLLDTGADVEALDELLATTRRRVPALASWVAEHPLEALAHRGVWDEVLATVEWMAANDTSTLYLRQMDVAGVDTKFVERHTRLLSDLLSLVDADSGTTADGSADRFGFRLKPSYARFRLLDARLPTPLPAGLTELTLRTDELARMDLGVSTVFIVENEVSYLAFPEVPGALVVFGSGFASSQLAGLDWLADKDVVYWGDIDTHGFAILSRLRQGLPGARSILMDHDTLAAHRPHWTTEPNPTRRPLPNLTATEQSLFDDLVTEHYGAGVRLEQERVRYSSVLRTLVAWTGCPG